MYPKLYSKTKDTEWGSIERHSISSTTKSMLTQDIGFRKLVLIPKSNILTFFNKLNVTQGGPDRRPRFMLPRFFWYHHLAIY